MHKNCLYYRVILEIYLARIYSYKSIWYERERLNQDYIYIYRIYKLN